MTDHYEELAREFLSDVVNRPRLAALLRRVAEEAQQDCRRERDSFAMELRRVLQRLDHGREINAEEIRGLLTRLGQPTLSLRAEEVRAESELSAAREQVKKLQSIIEWYEEKHRQRRDQLNEEQKHTEELEAQNKTLRDQVRRLTEALIVEHRKRQSCVGEPWCRVCDLVRVALAETAQPEEGK